MLKRCRRLVAPLHRRIFVWFGGAILMSGAAGFGASVLLGGAPEWKRVFDGGRMVFANRFAERWEDPQARRALAQEMAEQMQLRVTVRGTNNAVLDSHGGEICNRNDLSLTPMKDGVAVGRVDLCTTRSPYKRLSGLVGCFVGVAMLWLVAHKVARRLGRPILDLVEVTDAIGRGDYDVPIKMRRHAPVEVIHLGAAVKDMATKIKKQLDDQRELLASVSHEMRSPLARIRLLLELLRDDELPSSSRSSYLNELEQEIIEIDDLVGGLLAQSRVEFSALTLRPNDLVEAAKRALLRASIDDIGPIVKGDTRSVLFDATLVARALANLLDNAHKHGGGVRGVEVRFEAERVYVEVLDGGPGIGAADADAERIFDPFYGKPTGAHDSLGLGLALVRRIARAHRGDAYAMNRPEGGAIIGFWISSTTDESS